jgi:hypothetical protein
VIESRCLLSSHASLKLIRMTGLDRIIASTCHSSEDTPYWPALRLSILFAHYQCHWVVHAKLERDNLPLSYLSQRGSSCRPTPPCYPWTLADLEEVRELYSSDSGTSPPFIILILFLTKSLARLSDARSFSPMTAGQGQHYHYRALNSIVSMADTDVVVD